MRRIAALLTAATLAVGGAFPASAASKPYIGGPCQKVHQVDWIKNVRAQCTWVPAPKTKKKGRLIWKALPQAKLTATKKDLEQKPVTETPTVTVETTTVTETPTVTP